MASSKEQPPGLEIEIGGDGTKVILGSMAAIVLGIGLYAFAISLAPGLNIAIVVIGSAVALRLAAPAVVEISRAVVWMVATVRQLQLPPPHAHIEGEYRLEDKHDYHGR